MNSSVKIAPVETFVREALPKPMMNEIINIAEILSHMARWEVRAVILFDMLSASVQSVPAITSNDNGVAGPIHLGSWLPCCIGGMLETLKETEINDPAQSFVYSLSLHEQHRTAAYKWQQISAVNRNAVDQFLGRYPQIFDLCNHISETVQASKGALH